MREILILNIRIVNVNKHYFACQVLYHICIPNIFTNIEINYYTFQDVFIIGPCTCMCTKQEAQLFTKVALCEDANHVYILSFVDWKKISFVVVCHSMGLHKIYTLSIYPTLVKLATFYLL